MREPDTKSLTVKDGPVWGYGSWSMGFAAFARNGLLRLLVVEF